MPTSKLSLLFAFLYILPLSSWAQEYLFKNYTQENYNLAGVIVQAIYEDPRGMVWIGTNSGLNRFDGYNFKKFKEFDGTRINFFLEDVQEEGVIWIGTVAGLFKFNTFTEDLKQYQGSGLDNNKITCLARNRDQGIWIGTRNGLSYYKQQNSSFTSLKHLISPNGSKLYVNHLMQDKQGCLWIATRKKGLIRYNPRQQKINTFDLFRLKTKPLQKMPITKYVFEDSEANIWIGTTRGLLRYSPKNDHYQILDTVQVHHIYESKAQEIWVGTDHGLKVFATPDDSVFKTLNNPRVTSFRKNIVYYTLQTKQGGYYVGTAYDGLIRISQNKFHNHNMSQLKIKGNTVWAIEKVAPNLVWVGTTNHGISVFDETKQKVIKYYVPGDGLPSKSVFCIHKDKTGKIWVGTSGGVCYFDKVTGKFIPLEPKKNYRVRDIIDDVQGYLWIATDEGLKRIKLSNQNIEQKNIQIDSLRGGNLFRLMEDRLGRVWIATLTGSINCFNPKTNTFSLYNDLDCEETYDVAEDRQGHIWVGTNKGLVCLNPNTKQTTSYDISNGLPSNSVFNVVIDKNDHLWLTTALGIAYLVPDSLKKGHYSFINFDVKDGLQGNEFNSGGVDKRENWIYVGGSYGYNKYDPAEVVSRDFTPYRLQILHLATFGSNKLKQQFTQQKVAKALKQGFYLNNGGSFELKFVAPNHINPHRILYKVILAGYDDKWQFLAKKREVSYKKLPGGKYTLKLMHTNHLGEWSNDRFLTIDIEVPYKWYQLWEWQITLILTFLVSIYLLVNLAIWKNRKRRANLENKIKERTQEIEKKEKQTQQEKRKIQEEVEELKTYITIIHREKLDSQQQLKAIQLLGIEVIASQLEKLNHSFNKIDSSIKQLSSSSEIIDEATKYYVEFIDFSNGSHYKVETKDIICMEADNNNAFVYLTGHKKVRSTVNLLTMEQKLAKYDHFMRCHQGYIINTKHLKSRPKKKPGTHYYTVDLTEGRIAGVSRNHLKTVKKEFKS